LKVIIPKRECTQTGNEGGVKTLSLTLLRKGSLSGAPMDENNKEEVEKKGPQEEKRKKF